MVGTDPGPSNGTLYVCRECGVGVYALGEAGETNDYRPSAIADGGSASDSPVDLTSADHIDVYSRFEQWADQTGHALAPGFQRRTISSIGSERTHEVVTVPIICLVVYGSEQLREVIPCSTENRLRTVEDYLTVLHPVQNGDTVGTTIPDPVEEANG